MRLPKPKTGDWIVILLSVALLGAAAVIGETAARDLQVYLFWAGILGLGLLLLWHVFVWLWNGFHGPGDPKELGGAANLGGAFAGRDNSGVQQVFHGPVNFHAPPTGGLASAAAPPSAPTLGAPPEANEHATSVYRRKHDIPRLTVFDLFNTDFKGTQKICNRSILKHNDTGKEIRIWVCAVVDLERANKIVQCYVPSWKDTFGAATTIVELIPDTLKFSTDIKIESKPTGDTRIESSDEAHFSGLVFVYHETDMNAEQLGDLTKAYRESGYKVTFRGSAHLAHRKMQLSAGHIE